MPMVSAHVLRTALTRGAFVAQWASQGVFLLNAVLTVRAHAAASHGKQGCARNTSRLNCHRH